MTVVQSAQDCCWEQLNHAWVGTLWRAVGGRGGGGGGEETGLMN